MRNDLPEFWKTFVLFFLGVFQTITQCLPSIILWLSLILGILQICLTVKKLRGKNESVDNSKFD